MQQDQSIPLPSADITNPSFIPKVESHPSIPRSMHVSLSQLSFSSLTHLSDSLSNFKNPNEARPHVNKYTTNSITTKRHGSDIKVIYYGDQLEDKWENILPLTLDPLSKEDNIYEEDPNNLISNIQASTKGQSVELCQSPASRDTKATDGEIIDLSASESEFHDKISRLVTDLLENILKDLRFELSQKEEAALTKSTDLLVEYILIESCMEEYEESLSKSNLHRVEVQPIQEEYDHNDHIVEINKDSDSPIQTAMIHQEQELLEESHGDEIKELTGEEEADSDNSDFDDGELKNLQQEQLSRKVIERASKIFDAEMKGETAGLGKRASLYGSWTAGLNLSNNQSELQEWVMFTNKRRLIKLNWESISWDNPPRRASLTLDKKFDSYFPILLADTLSASFSADGILNIYFLERRIEKGPKLRSIQLGFDSETTAEVWALTIAARKWKESLQRIVEKKALLLVDKLLPDTMKLVNKYICPIFKCTAKLYDVKEIEIADADNTIISFMDRMPEAYDIIAVFCNQSSISNVMLQESISRFPNLRKINIQQDHGQIDAVDCASAMINSQSDANQISMFSCDIKRERKFFQKIIEQISEQVANSRKSFFSKPK